MAGNDALELPLGDGLNPGFDCGAIAIKDQGLQYGGDEGATAPVQCLKGRLPVCCPAKRIEPEVGLARSIRRVLGVLEGLSEGRDV